MKQKDIALLAGVAFLTAMISIILSNVVFGGFHKNTQVPKGESISTTFPDVVNDPSYNNIFNRNAFDPAQPVKPGDTNSQPFSGQ